MSDDGDNNNGNDPAVLADFLGGSLMRDLLADLAVGEDDAREWLDLEQLERELHHLDLLDGGGNNEQQQQPQQQSAAGLVVSSQIAAQQAFAPPPLFLAEPSSSSAASAERDALDAWSLSLQKFTASSSSVAADFLQADSARKQQQSNAAAAPPPPGIAPRPPPGLLDQAEEYDIAATSAAPPPPGIPPSHQQVISQAAAKLVQDLQIREEEIVTSQPPETDDIIAKTPDDEAVVVATSATTNLASPLLVEQLQKGLQAVHETEVLEHRATAQGAATPPTTRAGEVPQPPHVPKPLPVTPQNSMGYPQSQSQSRFGAPTPQPTPVASKPVNLAALNNVPPIPMMPPVVAVPLPQAQGPAWQTPPPPPPRRVVFANPHPAAPPVHAAQLQSRYMKARDITYVVHGMLRPILAAESSGQMSTYHIQYWTRHHPVKPPPASATNRKPTKQDFVARELASRAQKAQEWSESRRTLGSTAKTNVARPRALIAVTNTLGSAAADGADPSGRKQRAALWRARVYCDQAYQALQAVTDSWKAAGRAAAQPHLIRLFKCLGIHLQTVREESKDGGDPSEPVIRNQYSVDPAALQLLLKLPKGKILLARVLEQALLPPPVVPVFMPVALELLCGSAPSTAAAAATGGDVVDVADDRVFLAWTAVLRTLPVMAGGALLETVRGIMRQAPSNNVLSTTARMQCVHALLQRGGDLANNGKSSDDKNNKAFARDWAVAEQEFMALLA